MLNSASLTYRILQRTAVSTNIKERLDFSCALFGPDGGLVSNAPHIPVHLGAMQEAVQYQVTPPKFQKLAAPVFNTFHPDSCAPEVVIFVPVMFSYPTIP